MHIDISNIPFFKEEILKLNKIARNYPLQLFAVGGFVRDLLLKKTPKDIDFLVVSENIEIFEKYTNEVQDSFKLNKVIPAHFEEITRLISKKHCFDFTFVKNENLEDNLKSRDFTINSLALNLKSGKIVDFLNGIEDLNNKILKTNNFESFKNDPLRILRLFRFEATLNFKIDDKTKENAFANLHLIRKPAGERIKEELFSILKNDNSIHFIKPLFEKIIFKLFPKFEVLKGIKQNGYHHLDVLPHVQTVVEYTFDIPFLKKHYNKFQFNLTDEDKIALRLAAIFHDLGKGETFKINEKGLTTFHNHQYLSSDLFKEEIKFLNLSKNFTERVFFLIRRHMLFLNFMINGYSEKSFRKFINLMREDTVLLLLLVTADKLSAKGPLSKGSMGKLVEVGNAFLKVYEKDKDSILKLPKLVTGDEVMEIMDLKPSKEVGEIIHKIYEKQLEDKNFNREKALKMLQSLKKGNKK